METATTAQLLVGKTKIIVYGKREDICKERKSVLVNPFIKIKKLKKKLNISLTDS